MAICYHAPGEIGGEAFDFLAVLEEGGGAEPAGEAVFAGACPGDPVAAAGAEHGAIVSGIRQPAFFSSKSRRQDANKHDPGRNGPHRSPHRHLFLSKRPSPITAP